MLSKYNFFVFLIPQSMACKYHTHINYSALVVSFELVSLFALLSPPCLRVEQDIKKMSNFIENKMKKKRVDPKSKADCPVAAYLRTK